MVFQSSTLFDSMTLAENVALPLRKHQRMRHAAAIEEAHERLAQVYMADYAERYPAELSDGMRKRAAIARTLRCRRRSCCSTSRPPVSIPSARAASTVDQGARGVARRHGDRRLARSAVDLRIADRVAFIYRASFTSSRPQTSYARRRTRSSSSSFTGDRPDPWKRLGFEQTTRRSDIRPFVWIWVQPMSPAATTPHYTVQLLLPILRSSFRRSSIRSCSAGATMSSSSAARITDRALRLRDPDRRPAAARAHLRSSADAYRSELNDALAWSPTWPERYAAVDACKASIVISMVAHRQVNHATMLLAFLSCSTPCSARSTTCAGRIALDASAARDGVLELPHAAHGARTVRAGGQRAHRGDLGSRRGRRYVGLSGLGLPDLQTVVHGDPRTSRRRLVGLARSMFVGDALDCTWIEESSLVLPCATP